MTELFAAAIDQAKRHAREVFPREACGIVVNDEFIACENIAAPAEQHDPEDKNCPCQLCAFEIAMIDYQDYYISGELQAIVHSHPNHPGYPSKSDMEGQIRSGVPWILFSLDEEREGKAVVWGDSLPMRPIIGREFVPGASDCYSLVRDTFRLGSEGLAAQGMPEWPFPSVTLPEVPRDDSWWNSDLDLYTDMYAKNGFEIINQWEARPGDGFLMKIRSEKYNHGGLLVGRDLILHHLPTRLSRREPAGLWGRQAGLWLRYTGPVDEAGE